jgi:hypothetical protein
MVYTVYLATGTGEIKSVTKMPVGIPWFVYLLGALMRMIWKRYLDGRSSVASQHTQLTSNSNFILENIFSYVSTKN